MQPGGRVAVGNIKRQNDRLTIRFVATHGTASVPVEQRRKTTKRP